MPTRAPRRCTRMGCKGGYPCKRHSGPRVPRPTRQQLGYDEEWVKVISPGYLADHPMCEGCGYRRSRHTDHIDGDTSNREPENLQALCIPCHSRKTYDHDGSFGRPRTQR